MSRECAKTQRNILPQETEGTEKIIFHICGNLCVSVARIYSPRLTHKNNNTSRRDAEAQKKEQQYSENVSRKDSVLRIKIKYKFFIFGLKVSLS
jgi:hypothetical protein